MTDIGKKHNTAKNLFFQQLMLLLENEDWGIKLFKMIEVQCKFMPNYHLVLFPQGEAQIAQEFENWQDKKMLEILEHEDPQSKIRAKIARALEVRLMSVVPKGVVFKQNAWFLQPCNIFLGGQVYVKTCDLIWRYAGDKSDDFNYYTKRGLLLGVYISARLFYLCDNSQDFIETKKFIANSLDNIINIASIKNKIKIPS